MTAKSEVFKQQVTTLLEGALKVREDIFLIDFKITPDNSIKITIDGDRGVNLQDCMDVSRAIEHALDRDELDFALEVGSAGAGSPLKMPRQFKQHIGRKLQIFHGGMETEGTLEAANEVQITLSSKFREPKPIGKGKHTVRREVTIPFSDIDKAVVVLKF
jgi:ribosome maturation factor RimP